MDVTLKRDDEVETKFRYHNRNNKTNLKQSGWRQNTGVETSQTQHVPSSMYASSWIVFENLGVTTWTYSARTAARKAEVEANVTRAEPFGYLF